MNLSLRLKLLTLSQRALTVMADAQPTNGDKWITTEGGSRVLLDKNGIIKGGMGGKFTGQNIKDTGGTKEFTKYQTNEEREQVKPSNTYKGLELSKIPTDYIKSSLKSEKKQRGYADKEFGHFYPKDDKAYPFGNEQQKSDMKNMDRGYKEQYDTTTADIENLENELKKRGGSEQSQAKADKPNDDVKKYLTDRYSEELTSKGLTGEEHAKKLKDGFDFDNFKQYHWDKYRSDMEDQPRRDRQDALIEQKGGELVDLVNKHGLHSNEAQKAFEQLNEDHDTMGKIKNYVANRVDLFQPKQPAPEAKPTSET